MKKIFVALSALAVIASPVAVSAKEKAPKPVELSDAEISTLQMKNYDVGYEILFPAVMATLQGNGYVNINASKDAGTATAETEAKSKLVYNIFWGFGKKKRTQLASIFMEPTGSGSVLRLKLSIIEAKSRGGLGGSVSDGSPVKFGEPYQDFYTALDAEIGRRKANMVPVAAPAAAPAAEAPAAAPAAEAPTAAASPM
jgi:hypothetical protein